MERIEHDDGDWDQQLFAATLRMKLFGRNAAWLSRRDVLAFLRKQQIDNVLSLWKGESPVECFVTFSSPTSAEKLQALGDFRIGTTQVVVAGPTDVINDVRVHWTPAALTKKAVGRIFTSKGLTLLDYEEEKNPEDGLLTGVRRLRLVGDQGTWETIPHLVSFAQSGTNLLIIVPGRPPLCLKCRELGHHRAECPTNRRRPGPSAQQIQSQSASASKSLPPRRWEQLPTTTKPSGGLQTLGPVPKDQHLLERERLLKAVASSQRPATTVVPETHIQEKDDDSSSDDDHLVIDEQQEQQRPSKRPHSVMGDEDSAPPAGQPPHNSVPVDSPMEQSTQEQIYSIFGTPPLHTEPEDM